MRKQSRLARLEITRLSGSSEEANANSLTPVRKCHAGSLSDLTLCGPYRRVTMEPMRRIKYQLVNTRDGDDSKPLGD